MTMDYYVQEAMGKNQEIFRLAWFMTITYPAEKWILKCLDYKQYGD